MSVQGRARIDRPPQPRLEGQGTLTVCETQNNRLSSSSSIHSTMPYRTANTNVNRNSVGDNGFHDTVSVTVEQHQFGPRQATDILLECHRYLNNIQTLYDNGYVSEDDLQGLTSYLHYLCCRAVKPAVDDQTENQQT